MTPPSLDTITYQRDGVVVSEPLQEVGDSLPELLVAHESLEHPQNGGALEDTVRPSAHFVVVARLYMELQWSYLLVRFVLIRSFRSFSFILFTFVHIGRSKPFV